MLESLPGFSARWRLLPLLCLCALLSACIESELQDAPANAQPASANAFFDDEGAAVQVLDATGQNAWVYFDLDTFSVVFPDNPDNDTRWDLAFQRFRIKVNGGVSGTGGVTAAALQDTVLQDVTGAPADGFFGDRALTGLSDAELVQLGDNLFFSVCASDHDNPETSSYCLYNGQVDRTNLNPDEAAYVFLTQGSGVQKNADGSDGDPILGWYDYYQDEGHILRPAADSWVIRSTDGVEFVLQMVGYYGYVERDGEAGTIAFRYLSLTPGFEIPPPGGQQLFAEASADATSGTAPLTVNFLGSATGAQGNTVWHWDFGDGSSSGLQNPQHVYTDPQTYTATLTVSDDRGADAAASDTLVITVAQPGLQPPVASAGADRTLTLGTGQVQATVTLDGSLSSDPDGQIVSYRWTGTPDPDDVPQPQVVLGAGSYSFTLTITDDAGNTHSDTVSVVVNAASNMSPTAAAIASVQDGMAPLSVQFSGSLSADGDGSIVSWHWDFGDGTTLDGVTDPVHVYTQAGNYTATLTVTDDGGATGTASVAIDAWLRADVVQDTYVYEFLGNQADAGDLGNSGGILVWNHESNHGTKGLLGFDNAWLSDAVFAGGYTATLFLYAYDPGSDSSGYIGASPGDADADNPYTPGIATVKTDIFLQPLAWSEADAGLAWATIAEIGMPFATLTQSGIGEWLSVDVTSLVAQWVSGGNTDFGLALSQEAYDVVRADNGSIAVAAFCDSESTDPTCDENTLGFDPRPYLEIRVAP